MVQHRETDVRLRSYRRTARTVPSKVHEWVFLDGSRLVLAAVLLVAFGTFVSLLDSWFGVTRIELSPVYYLLSAIFGGNFTLISVVLSINQLVISRQLSDLGELREQISEAMDYRQKAVELTDVDTAPVTPAAFVEVLFEGICDALGDIERQRERLGSEVDAEVEEWSRPLDRHAASVLRGIKDSDSEVFGTLVLMLDSNYSQEMYDIVEFRKKRGDDLPDEMEETLEGLVVRLRQIDVARQYLKTLYMQVELARLSRRLLYVGMPAILLTMTVLTILSITPSTVASIGQLSSVILVVSTVGTAPLMVLVSYVLRLSVVSERTVAITPFTTPTQEQPTFKSP
ncbi:hypothetical protein [Halopelagius longus]|uniref:Uncharacterized protein n=1 Tax=Halopelagius longus TaxID=1236180 RepID=A0A1H1BTL7_9EURY|nr:hypothetical protein [Halopelagius longus]RDI70918.1 hypothetical protein DWB78_03780 [Halopelagius longus]SDQ55241.1 hypothetical protein SAMN05216278_1945 [Halopelagius longus]